MTPKQQVEILMGEMVAFAKRMLAEHGEFHPFGGYVKMNGEIVHTGANLEGTDHPSGRRLIEVLTEFFRDLARKGECKATATVFRVTVNAPKSAEKTDAIQVDLEHVDHYSATVFFPYRLEENNRVAYGEVFAQRGSFTIFGK